MPLGTSCNMLEFLSLETSLGEPCAARCEKLLSGVSGCCQLEQYALGTLGVGHHLGGRSSWSAGL